MAWLNGWLNRVKITVSHTNIDSDLTHFALPVFLGSSVGASNQDLTAVFDEIGSSYLKLAVTTSDGETQLYVEVEKWDAVNELALLWVSKSDWVISGSADTELYLYFDSSVSDNTGYVSTSGGRTEIWDSNTVARYGMNQNPGGTAPQLIDSTSNNHDATCYGSMTSGDLVQGNPDGYCIDYDGSNDYSTLGFRLPTGAVSLSFHVYIPNQPSSSNREILSDVFGTADYGLRTWLSTAGDFAFAGCRGSSGSWNFNLPYAVNCSAQWHHILCTWDGTTGSNGVKIYINGVLAAQGTAAVSNGTTHTSNAYMARRTDDASRWYYGIIDSVSVYNTNLSAAFAKADYYVKTDSVITFSIIEKGVVASSFIETLTLSGINFFPQVSVGHFIEILGITALPSNKNISYFYRRLWNTSTSTYNGVQKVYESPYIGWTVLNSAIHAAYNTGYASNVLALCSDDSGNVYVGMSYNNVRYLDCIDKSGATIWHRSLPVGSVVIKSMDTGGTYLYVGTDYNSGKIYKFNCSDGSEVTGGGFPITSSMIDGNDLVRIRYGRDGYLYALVNNDTNTYNGFIYKIDPSDGSEEWNYQITQGVSGNDGRDIDINASGQVAIASINMQSGLDTHVLTAAGALDSEWDIGAQVRKIAIDDDGYVYCAPESNPSSISLCKYDPASTGSPIWTNTDLSDTCIFLEVSADGEKLYYEESILGGKFYVFSLSGDIELEFDSGRGGGAINADLVPAWYITITDPDNGSITNSTGIEFETGIYLFPSNEDIEFQFSGDSGYTSKGVEVDNVQQGEIPDYTFSELAAMHSLEASFMPYIAVGVFTETGSIVAATLIGVPASSFLETSALLATFVKTFSSCIFTETNLLTANWFSISALSKSYDALYSCILTGTPDGLSDITLPMSSFSARIRTETPTYCGVIVPNAILYTDSISARPNGQLVVKFYTSGQSGYYEVVRVDLESIAYDTGVKNSSLSLSGHITKTYSDPKTVDMTGLIFQESLQANGLMRIKTSVNFLINPGDTVEWNNGSSSIVAGLITINVGKTAYMDITEAST